jgi:hypothetical protein
MLLRQPAQREQHRLVDDGADDDPLHQLGA